MPSRLQWIDSCTDMSRKILWPPYSMEVFQAWIWYCEIVVRPPPSAASKSCSVSNTPTRPRYVDLTYHSTESSCPNAWYLILTRSEFLIPHSEVRQRELANRIWKCHLHISTFATTQASQHNQQQQQQLLQQPVLSPQTRCTSTVVMKVIMRSAVLALKLHLVTSTGTATNVLKFCNIPVQPTSFSFLLPPTPFHLNRYQLNRGINSQTYSGTPMRSGRNYLNCATD